MATDHDLTELALNGVLRVEVGAEGSSFGGCFRAVLVALGRAGSSPLDQVRVVELTDVQSLVKHHQDVVEHMTDSGLFKHRKQAALSVPLQGQMARYLRDLGDGRPCIAMAIRKHEIQVAEETKRNKEKQAMGPASQGHIDWQAARAAHADSQLQAPEAIKELLVWRVHNSTKKRFRGLFEAENPDVSSKDGSPEFEAALAAWMDRDKKVGKTCAGSGGGRMYSPLLKGAAASGQLKSKLKDEWVEEIRAGQQKENGTCLWWKEYQYDESAMSSFRLKANNEYAAQYPPPQA